MMRGGRSKPLKQPASRNGEAYLSWYSAGARVPSTDTLMRILTLQRGRWSRFFSSGILTRSAPDGSVTSKDTARSPRSTRSYLDGRRPNRTRSFSQLGEKGLAVHSAHHAKFNEAYRERLNADLVSPR